MSGLLKTQPIRINPMIHYDSVYIFVYNFEYMYVFLPIIFYNRKRRSEEGMRYD